jgi:hypothetical protein
LLHEVSDLGLANKYLRDSTECGHAFLELVLTSMKTMIGVVLKKEKALFLCARL